MDKPDLTPEANDLYQDILSAISLHTKDRDSAHELTFDQDRVLALAVEIICEAAFDTDKFDGALFKLVCLVALETTEMTQDDLRELLDEKVARQDARERLH